MADLEDAVQRAEDLCEKAAIPMHKAALQEFAEAKVLCAPTPTTTHASHVNIRVFRFR